MEDFNLMANGFDTEKRIRRATVIADKIRTHITDGHRKSAIEYGCGTGLVGLQLKNDFGQMLLVDSSTEMINQVELKLRKINYPTASNGASPSSGVFNPEGINTPRITTLCCDFMTDASQIPRVDYIFSSLVMHHIMDTEKFLHRLYNMLHDGGRILIIDIDKEDGGFHGKYPEFDGHNGFEHSHLIDMAMDVGFTNVKIETFYHDVKIFNGKESPYSLLILDATR